SSDPAADGQSHKPATEATVNVLKGFEPPVGDFLDGTLMLDFSRRTQVAPLPDDFEAFSLKKFEYLLGDDSPAQMHPSLYHASAVLVQDTGLFKLADGVYQIRGDISQITLIRGDTGWIVLDTGMVKEVSAELFAFAQRHLPGGAEVPISAVYYSHSHIDHYGGVRGLIEEDDVRSGKVPVIAPYGFMEQVVNENILAGNVMGRRAQYHFGQALPVREDGSGFASIGGALQITQGESTLIEPTRILPQGPGEITAMTVDGVDMFFKDISGAEAPAASLVYVPAYKMIFNSELMFRGMHNIYSLRGVQVRDALGWSRYINEVLLTWGDEAEIMCGPHGPAIFGNPYIREFLRMQRDNFGFIHNQSLRLANEGVKIQDVGTEVASMVPESLQKVWHTHGYHGTYSHNARAVVNRYLGFYDGNPANLDPLPTRDEAVRFVRYMGGADAVIANAAEDFAIGDYRWVATVLNKVVTADPANAEARTLLADTYEQLGYQAEGPQWRHAYLSAAVELRTGERLQVAAQMVSPDILKAISVGQLLDFVAVRLNSEKAGDAFFRLNLVLSDAGETYYVELSNGNLSNALVDGRRPADTTITLPEKMAKLMLSGRVTLKDMVARDLATVEGRDDLLSIIRSMLDTFEPDFDLVPMPH
ncbi:MAG: alkyl sulfatase dimerization domain-containing protein, partial [Lysobacterales bacterium]